jgi:hypothetical protein
MKTKIKVLFSSLLLGSLSSCIELPYRPVYPIDLENVSYNLVDPRDKHTLGNLYSNLNQNYVVVPDSFNHLDYGFVTIKSLDYGRYGTYSFLTGKIAVPTEYASLEYLDRGSAGVYVKGFLPSPEGKTFTPETQVCDLYDYRGGVVATSFLNKDMALRTWTYEDLNGLTVLLERFNLGSSSWTYRVNADGTRTLPVDRAWTLIKGPDGDRIPFTSSLRDLGLADYTGYLSVNSWLSCRRGTGRTDIYIPDRMDRYAFFWKCLFYQNQVEVTDEDYDYVNAGKRYQLQTRRIPLVSGNIQNVDFPYYIDELTPLYSDEHITHYAKAVVRKIINKKLDDYLSVFVINNDGVVLADVTEEPIYFKGTEVMDGGHFITSDHLNLIDSDFALAKTLDQAPSQIAYNSDCMSVQQSDGSYALVDFSGDPRFADTYRYARIDALYDGCGFAQKKDGSYCALKLSDKTEIPLKVDWGYHFEDIGYGFLRMRKANISYYRSYDWSYNPNDPEMGTIIATGGGSNLFNHWVVDVTTDDSGYPYAYRAFYSD